MPRGSSKGLSQNVTRFVILWNEVTKDLSYEVFQKLLEKILRFAQNDTAF